MTDTLITCPNCGAEIPVSQVLQQQIRGDLERRLRAEQEQRLQAAVDQAEQRAREGLDLELRDLRNRLAEQSEVARQAKARQLELRQQTRELESQRQALQAEIEKGVAERLQQEVDKQLQARLSAAQAQARQELALLEQQLQAERHRVEEAQRLELALRKEKGQLEARAREMELEVQRRLDEEKQKFERGVRESLQQEQALKLMEKEKQIQDLHQALEEAKRRSELGSQELQGEVLELDMENMLRTRFAADLIEPVKKGARGADILHSVRDGQLRPCGAIIWEAKNARHYAPAWIGKLKDDQRAAGAGIAVLVTMTLPDEIQGFGQVDGVWITDRAHYLALATALRTQLIAVTQARAAATGIATKMELLYDYLAGDEFRHRIEAIVEAFDAMQEQVQKEKRAMHRQWREREKQIERVMLSTTGMYGDLQGIIGNAMQRVPALELDDDNLLENEEEVDEG